MTPEVLASLIVSGSALLVAIIGFFGSLFISMRTSSNVVEQMRHEVRYTRAHERRDEVLATIYGLLTDVDFEHRTWLTRAYGRDAQEQAKRASERLAELSAYFIKYRVWMRPKVIADEAADLMSAFATWNEKLWHVTKEGSRAEYEEVMREAATQLDDNEAENSLAMRIVRLEQMISQSLGLTELEDRA